MRLDQKEGAWGQTCDGGTVGKYNPLHCGPVLKRKSPVLGAWTGKKKANTLIMFMWSERESNSRGSLTGEFTSQKGPGAGPRKGERFIWYRMKEK